MLWVISPVLASFLALVPASSRAANANWVLNPVNSDWHTAANWSTQQVPNFGDNAIFDVSNQTDISLSGTANIERIIFAPTAPAYQITSPANRLLFINNGIDNQSAETQNFISTAAGNGAGNIQFAPVGDAGTNTIFTTQGAVVSGGDWGRVQFLLDTSAASAQIINEGGTVAGAFGGQTEFYDTSRAANALIINKAGTVDGASGGLTRFWLRDPRAENAQIICEGATVSGAGGGTVLFQDASHASNAVVIAQAGSNGGAGGSISFEQTSRGEFVRIELFGNGQLDISTHRSPATSIGSLEGDGPVFLGALTLIVGDNSLDTVYSGNIQDSGTLSKVGPGSLTLAGASTYTGGTAVSEGTLVVTNQTGSATGTGDVSVTAGTLSGSGIIAGAATIGTGSGAGAFLAPAAGPKKQRTLTIEGALTFNSDATYTYTFRARGTKARSDQVITNGVTIDGNAFFAFQGIAQGTLDPGLTFTAITNTAATPIAGTFSNLPDGGILTVNGNNFQADYEGGDGNDLTLTVLP